MGDWLEALKAEERSVLWLARQTKRHPSTVYNYAKGRRTPPSDWLRAASKALGMRQK